MKVSLLLGGLTPGAMTSALSTLARGLQDLGVEVELVVLRASPDELLEHAALSIRHLGTRRSSLSVLAIARYLREVKPDVLFSAPNTMNISAIVASRVARAGNKVVISERGNLSFDIAIEYARSFKMRAVPWLMKLTYPMADGITAPSHGPLTDELFTRMVKMQNVPQAVIPNAVTYRIEQQETLRERIDWRWGKEATSYPLLIAVGRLVHQKGFDILVDSVAELRDLGRDARLLILGEGAMRRSLERQIIQRDLQDRVILGGRVPNPLPYMREAQVFVLSSRWESFGNVLIEAMYCALPIVTTDAPVGPRYILRDGETAVFVDVDDVHSLAMGIDRILNDRGLARRLGSGAQKESQKYSSNIVAGQYLEFFQRVVED